MTETQTFRGVLQKVEPRGRHGPYAITSVERLGSVTFSLEKGVWNEKDMPKPGEMLILSELREKRAGWRAMRARYVKPSDDRRNGTSSNQQRSNKQ